MLEKLPEPLGQLLQIRRAGPEKLALSRLLKQRQVRPLTVLSSAFEHLRPIPVQYTADGDGLSPPLSWHGVPESANCVVLIIEDADSPTPQPLVHAIAIVQPPEDGYLQSGALSTPQPAGRQAGHLSISTGLNSLLRHGWLPPDPPRGHGRHRYAFQVFALSGGHRLSASPGRHELFDAIRSHAIAAGCLIGMYERSRTEEIPAGRTVADQDAVEIIGPDDRVLAG